MVITIPKYQYIIFVYTKLLDTSIQIVGTFLGQKLIVLENNKKYLVIDHELLLIYTVKLYINVDLYVL